MLPNFMYSLNRSPDTRKPLSTKNKSTPIHPILVVNLNRYWCLSSTSMMATPRRKSSSRSLVAGFLTLLFPIGAGRFSCGRSVSVWGIYGVIFDETKLPVQCIFFYYKLQVVDSYEKIKKHLLFVDASICLGCFAVTVRPGSQNSDNQASLPWQFLYFLPLPQGQGSLRPVLGPTFIGSCLTAVPEGSK